MSHKLEIGMGDKRERTVRMLRRRAGRSMNTVEMNAIGKGFEIPDEDVIREGDHWVVISQTEDGSDPSKDNWYYVWEEGGNYQCTCPAYKWHQVCKHEQAVQIKTRLF